MPSSKSVKKGTPGSESSTVKLAEEVVEHKWSIPNFLPVVSAVRNNDVDRFLASIGRFAFYIGSDPANPMNNWPIRAEAMITKGSTERDFQPVWISLSLLDRPLHPLCSVEINMEFLKIISDIETATVLKDVPVAKRSFQWNVSDFVTELFKQADSESLVDQEGTLHFHLKLKANITRPRDAQPASVDLYDFQSCGSQVLGDLEAMFNDSTTADFQVKVTGKKTMTFHCHKAILAARCPMFRGMLASKMKESQKNVLEVNDISCKTMGLFLSFLYSGRFKHSSWIKSIPKLLVAADKYDVKTLRALCDNHLIKTVTCGNALSLARLAKRHGYLKALSDIQKFIVANVEELNYDSYAESEDEEA